MTDGNENSMQLTWKERQLLAEGLVCLRETIFAINRLDAGRDRISVDLEQADCLYQRLTGKRLIDEDVAYYTGLPV